MLNVVDLFDTDEKIYLNKASARVTPENFTRERILKSLSLAAAITNKDNFLLCSFIDGLATKISKMNDSEWKRVVNALPFTLTYGNNIPSFD